MILLISKSLSESTVATLVIKNVNFCETLKLSNKTIHSVHYLHTQVDFTVW